jgi:hypothetical protein
MFASRAVPEGAHIVVAGHSAATASVVPGVAEQETPAPPARADGWRASELHGYRSRNQGIRLEEEVLRPGFDDILCPPQPSDIFIAEAHKLGPFPLSVGQVRLRKVPREVAQQQEKHSSRPRVAQ